jgi:hypothetical protein
VVCGGVRGCRSQAQSVAGREPSVMQAGNPVPVAGCAAGLCGGGIMVRHIPLPFHYTEQSFLVRRPMDPGS